MEHNQDVNQGLLQNGVKKIVIVKEVSKTSSAQPILSVADILLSIFVVTPLVVGTWRGIWGLMDIYSRYVPAIPSFIVGMGVHIVFAMCQNSLHNVFVEADKNWILKIVLQIFRRFYTYIFCIVIIVQWRGLWALIDYYTNIQVNENFVVQKTRSQGVLIIGASCFTILVVSRGLRSTTSPPFVVCLDKGPFVFRFPTMYEKKTKNNTFLYLLDCIFSVCIMGNLVVALWRSMWVVADILMLPNDYIRSAWMSTVLGLLLIGLAFRLQKCMKKVCAKFSGIKKILLADCYILLSFISSVLYWRGLWNFLCIYFLPDDVELSCQLNNIFGLTTLIIIGCSNTLLYRGIYRDGKEPEGDCVVFSCQYLQVILDRENLDDQVTDDAQESNEKNTLNDNKV